MITLLLLVRATYMYGAVFHAHPVHGESHNQHNTTGEVATLPTVKFNNSQRYFQQANLNNCGNYW